MRGQKTNRNIINALEMLKYLYSEINGRKFKAMDITKCQTLDDLYALVITTWCGALAKEGLYKEYITHENEEMTAPQGQINFQEVISKQSKMRGTLICTYDELSENVYMNHMLKGTLQYFIYDSAINQVIKTEVQKTLQMFNGVDSVDINRIKWKTIRYNNSTMRYKHVLEMCKTLLDERQLQKSYEYTESERLFVLFKRQLIKYIDTTYGDRYNVTTFEMPYTLDNEPLFESRIFRQQKMVVISTDDIALVYIIRMQDRKMITDNKVVRARLDEFVEYLRQYKKDHGKKVYGAMLYINIDETKLNLQPMSINCVSDYMVGDVVIDIYDQWRFIVNKVDDAYRYFIERKEKKKH